MYIDFINKKNLRKTTFKCKEVYLLLLSINLILYYICDYDTIILYIMLLVLIP